MRLNGFKEQSHVSRNIKFNILLLQQAPEKIVDSAQHEPRTISGENTRLERFLEAQDSPGYISDKQPESLLGTNNKPSPLVRFSQNSLSSLF